MAVPNENTTNLPSDAAGKYYPGLYNPGTGTFWAPRANGYIIVLSGPTARTATPSIATFDNPDYHGMHLVIYTSAASTPSTVVTIKGVDPYTGQSYTILVAAAITAAGTVVLRVFPALTASANLIANDVIPSQFTCTSVHGNGNSHTYAISALMVR